MDPEALVTELDTVGGVRRFEISLETILNLCRLEIQSCIADPSGVPDGELLPLLAECQALGSEAFDLVTTAKSSASPKLLPARAAALGLCKRWFLARLHLRLERVAVDFFWPKLVDYAE